MQQIIIKECNKSLSEEIINKIYDSYDDTKGLDHAGFGIKYLFEENNIRKYVEDDKYDSIIYKAIDNHSKLKIADIDSMTETEKILTDFNETVWQENQKWNLGNPLLTI